MNLDQILAFQISLGFHRIGQVEILHNKTLPIIADSSVQFVLCHQDDREEVALNLGMPNNFRVETDSQQARDISICTDDGEYRFTKGQTNLKRGWVIHVRNIYDLRLALEGLYPASFSLWVAQQRGILEPLYLRDKLNRQTGMYRYARSISNEGAQMLIQKICGPAHQCAKKILWEIDHETPLENSAASQFDGISSGLPYPKAIPLLCQEACNHFVAECRKQAKVEFEKANAK
jgi:4Fe-4S iron-sulfur cluster binding domain/DR2241 stabilising domain